MHPPQRIAEDELIRQCKAGSLKYQELLYKQFYGYAMGIGLRYCPNRDDALEVIDNIPAKTLSYFTQSAVMTDKKRRVAVSTSRVDILLYSEKGR